ncbi:heavy metal transport/detoxification superfamily protein [Striga asiatica]|uniref:Heavy metal transport/detoxification superfamily protein n=1 Tax=Striga asiatica TaxID=4170 RepID=A0A5A7Q3E5_STRAF|nr:heavy metal transport/detoxification superfamily protein [Striga asiatica]
MNAKLKNNKNGQRTQEGQQRPESEQPKVHSTTGDEKSRHWPQQPQPRRSRIPTPGKQDKRGGKGTHLNSILRSAKVETATQPLHRESEISTAPKTRQRNSLRRSSNMRNPEHSERPVALTCGNCDTAMQSFPSGRGNQRITVTKS